ncbi:hydroxyethylthiazole kinase [Rummeliibacillus pycnus]|uniref:hydroxyethylthiazole kinase n=1 Tax=Rummeliibacillus pycnus TaxID=101070 RepID=UPI000C9A35B4|nr:hydroxyethylthiazole kinase [Rummeliibacillus pycnus]
MSISKIRMTSPLVHCITNYVVANFTANGLLAIGASPVMADEVSEVEEMVSNASALLLNIGTINSRTKQAMILAGRKANERQIPVVLDPVGVGATAFRKQTVQELLEAVKFALIRCNVGELATIAGVKWQAKGVDSGEGEIDVVQVAQQVARQYHCLVIVTGPADILTNGEQTYSIAGGHELMTQVTGTGCLLSAICTAALAVVGDPLIVLHDVLQDYKNVAERASIAGPLGSFQVEVVNGLHDLSRGEQ